MLALATRSARASPSAKLVYVRGAGADARPAEAALRKAVAIRLGYDPFLAAAQKTVIAQVTRTSEGYRARVQIVDDDGKARGERDRATWTMSGYSEEVRAMPASLARVARARI